MTTFQPVTMDSVVVGHSARMRAVFEFLRIIASSDSTVLVTGESGTGKEVTATLIHQGSRRRTRPFVAVSCALFSETLIESELFGHERGAFTGAVKDRPGRFELAEGGTIFLDDIDDVPLSMQVKLLRVLQNRTVERLGGTRTISVNVRVIAGTKRDLKQLVAEGKFREDLFYRLNVLPVTLPPLRERPDDVTRLVWHFIERHQHKLAQRIDSVPAEVMQALRNHDWPGNIRELENVIERALIRTAGSTLQLDHPLRVGPRRGGASRLASCSDTLDDVQRCHIERVLRECGGRINGAGNAAVRLGIHPNTLRYRIKKLGLVVAMRQSGEPAPSAARPG